MISSMKVMVAPIAIRQPTVVPLDSSQAATPEGAAPLRAVWGESPHSAASPGFAALKTGAPGLVPASAGTLAAGTPASDRLAPARLYRFPESWSRSQMV